VFGQEDATGNQSRQRCRGHSRPGEARSIEYCCRAQLHQEPRGADLLPPRLCHRVGGASVDHTLHLREPDRGRRHTSTAVSPLRPRPIRNHSHHDQRRSASTMQPQSPGHRIPGGMDTDDAHLPVEPQPEGDVRYISDHRRGQCINSDDSVFHNLLSLLGQPGGQGIPIVVGEAERRKTLVSRSSPDLPCALPAGSRNSERIWSGRRVVKSRHSGCQPRVSRGHHLPLPTRLRQLRRRGARVARIRTPKTAEPVQPPGGEPDRELRVDPMASAHVVPRKRGAHDDVSGSPVRVRRGHRRHVLLALQSERREHTGCRALARLAQHIGHFLAPDRGPRRPPDSPRGARDDTRPHVDGATRHPRRTNKTPVWSSYSPAASRISSTSIT